MFAVTSLFWKAIYIAEPADKWPARAAPVDDKDHMEWDVVQRAAVGTNTPGFNRSR